MPVSIMLGLLLVLAGAFLAYAGARNQRLAVHTSPTPILGWVGAAAMLVSLLLLLQWFGAATAVFAWTTLAMLTWSLVPLVVAWWRRPRGNAE